MEERLRKLERRTRVLAALLVAGLLGGVVIAAAPANDTIQAREIVLSHPNGGSTITLRASPNLSGMWIGKQDGNSQSVAIYNDKNTAAIGTFGGQHGQAMDACLASTNTGPVFQLAGADRTIALSPKNWKPDAGKLTDYTEVRFYPPAQASSTPAPQ